MEKAPELAEWGFIPEAGKVDVEVQRRSAFPWNLFSVALLAGAVTGAAAGAVWTSVPRLAATPALEGTRANEPSEIWREAADQQAIERARGALAVPLPALDESPPRVNIDAASAPSINEPAKPESGDSDPSERASRASQEDNPY
jgi:hypothetical protein